MIVSERWPTDIEEALLSLKYITDGLPVGLAYLRVSSDIQVDEGHALEVQADVLREEYIRRFPEGCHLIFASDEGLSGTLPFLKKGLKKSQFRPGLTLVKELVELGVAQAVGVYKCNRFARKLRIWLEFSEDYLDPNNVLFFSAAEGVDNQDSGGRLVLQILMSGAEFEREQIVSAANDGLKTRRSEGYYLGEPPYGWRWQDHRFVPMGSRVNIEPVPEEAEVIRKVVAWYLDGRSPNWIAKELNAQGVPTARNCHKWRKNAVRYILTCPTNAGLLRDGSGGLVEGNHYPLRIIEPEVFYAVQREMARRREASRDTNRPGDLLFEHLLKCGLCGKKLEVSSPKNSPPAYICPGRKPGCEHRMFSLRVDLVESRLEKLLLRSAGSSTVTDATTTSIRERFESHEQSLRRDQRRLSDKLKKNEDDICLWAGRLAKQDCDAGEAQDELRRLSAERKRLEADLDRTNKEIKRQKSRSRKCESAAALVKEVPKLWTAMTLEEKRQLASVLVESLTCEPTPTGVALHVSTITTGDETLRFYVRAKAPQDCGDLYAIGPSLLTTAYYLRQGLSIREIASARGITAEAVATQVSALRRITGVKAIQAVNEALAPVIDARADELYVAGRKPPKTGRRAKTWTARQVELLELRARGLTLPQTAKEMGIRFAGASSIQVRVFKKLGVHCVRDAVRAALELGLIQGSVES